MSGNERKSILVADDNRFFRSMMAYVLDEEGYRTLSVGSGDELLELLGRELPEIHLFVLDLVMPGLDGLELVERIRKTPGAESIPILILSQFGVNGLEREILRTHGVESVMPKSASVERILYEVREALHPEDRNRRTAARTPIAIPVAVKAPRGNWLATTFNLSEAGMFLALSEEEAPREGTEVDLRFWVPESDGVLALRGRVMWANAPGPAIRRSHPPGFGVEFVDAPAAAREAIGRYLRALG